jgi:hypothetical protein
MIVALARYYRFVSRPATMCDSDDDSECCCAHEVSAALTLAHKLSSLGFQHLAWSIRTLTTQRNNAERLAEELKHLSKPVDVDGYNVAQDALIELYKSLLAERAPLAAGSNP